MSVTDLPRPARPATPRVLPLGAHGDLPAVVTDRETLTHRDLADRVAEVAARLGTARRLVLLSAGNDLDSLVTYLACLTAGHVTLLVPHGTTYDEVLAAHDPDVVVDRTAGGLVERRPGTRHSLHPDLALLLSTSGSTGSPKLVRLSHHNLASNARAIADYLGLTPEDRAVTSLPLHYCYGLSVVHSHLLVGASLVLTDLSVVDECFWELAETHRATSFAGVPHTFELLERSGFADRALPHLRQVTQAGGRMEPERVRRWARLGEQRGFDLFVMYGQTEASARMAWLPPALAASYPEAVGVPVPGGSFRLDPVEGSAPGGGEVVYRGPNVMMGYAESPADLSRGPEVTELRTGDLGEIRDGLLHLTGRRNRLAKLYGLRLDLSRLELRLAADGIPASLVAHDGRLWAFVAHGRHHGRIRNTLRQVTGLPAGAIRAEVLGDLPRTPSGKPDLTALTAIAATRADGPEAPLVDVAGEFARVLGLARVDVGRSFVELGGDSLSYVELSTRLERLLPGGLPPGWHTRPVSEIAAVLDGPITTGRRIETSVLLRALAIVAIVASHADVVDVMGGAHVLLGVLGFNLARFPLAHPGVWDRWRHGLRSLAVVLVPTALWIAGAVVLTDDYGWGNLAMVRTFTGRSGWDSGWHFWFLEALLWCSLAALALVTIPSVHRRYRRRPFSVAAAVLAAATAIRFAVAGVETGSLARYQVEVVACFVALGWTAAVATRIPHRLVASVAAVAMTVGFFDDLTREATVAAGLLALVWLPTVRLPRLLARPVIPVAGVLAASSLYVYLTHWQVYRPLEDAGHPWMAVLASFAVGIGVWLVVRRWPLLLAPGRRTRGEERHSPARGFWHGHRATATPGSDSL